MTDFSKKIKKMHYYLKHLLLAYATLQIRLSYNSRVRRILHSSIVYSLSLLLTFQPVMSNAGGLVVDGSAPISQRPVLDSAQNGVPVVNITNPSAGGVSRNSFSDFNVGVRGVIINNSLAVGISQLGGALPGNSNFTSGQTARIILNEVNGTGRSNINGATEIFGDRAEYVLANPNGITCNGCSYINTPHVTLSTGTADVSGGILRGFNVSSGDITFTGQDVNVTNLDAFDIISRTASFAASVYAGGELNVITGNNYVDYSSKAITAASSTSAAPQIAIDSSALGGMYAGKINLVATESGVGVNTQGSLGASTSDISITADGHIEFKNANANNDIKITSAHSGVKHSGNSYAAGKTEITAAQAFELADGFTAAKGDVKVNSATLDENSSASIMAGVDSIISGADVTFTNNGIGNLVISASVSNAGFMSGSSITANADSFNNTGLVQSAGDITITAGSIANLSNYAFDTGGNIAGGINSSGKLTLTSTSGNVDNTGGALSSTQLLTITSANRLINNSLISGSSDIIITATNVDNSNSYFTNASGYLISGILAGGGIRYQVSGGGLDNTNGAIKANSLNITSAGGLTNDSGLINSATTIDTTTVGMSNNSGSISANGDVRINAGSSNVSNINGIINTTGNIDINHAAAMRNTGLISGTSSVGISANSIDNHNSYHTNSNGALTTGILSSGAITLTTSAISNNTGAIYGMNLTLNAAGELDNTAGLVQATNTASITANIINNSSTYTGTLGIVAASAITIVAGDINNTSGAIKSGGIITATSTGTVTNTGLVQSASDTTITAASVNNSNNFHNDSNGNLDKGILSGGKLDVHTTAGVINSNGALYSNDKLTVNAGSSVTSSGVIASEDDISITASSIANSGGVITSHDIAIVATTSDISNTGGRISGNNVGITASNGNFDNTNGLSQSAGTTTINSQGVVNDSSYHFTNGTLDKGIISTGDVTATVGANGFSNSSGAITSSGKIIIATTGNLRNSGLINARQELQINAANINNSNSYLLDSGSLVKGLISQSTIDLSASSGDIVNTNGTISGNGLTLTASGQLINNRLIQSTGNIDVNAASVDNSGSYAADFSKGIIATGDIRFQVLGVSDASINNNNGTIAGNNIDINSNGVFTNDAGLVQSSGNTNISATAIDNSNTNIVDVSGTLIKGIISSGLLTLNSTSADIDNTSGALSSGSDTAITSRGSFTNSGLVQSAGNLNITASGIDNSNSYAVTNGKLSKGLIASGAITLNAGTGDISNEHGGISSSKTFSLSGYNVDNNNGYVSASGVTGTSLIIAANAINNQSGSILAKANLTISGASGDNTNGGVISAKNALHITIANGGELDNTGGDIYSEIGTITGQNIDNNSGRIQAANGVTITQTEGVFDNRGGTVFAFADDSTVTINAASNIMNQGGNIISIQNTDLNLGTDYTITGTITTGGHVDITATSITNNAVVTAGDYINLVTTSGDLTNNSGGQLISGTLITLNSSGNLYNYGIISGPIITITATNGGVYNYSEITSAGTLDINATSSVNNYGRISAEGDANINAVTITNSNGQIASNDTLTLTTNSIHNVNGGLLYATNDLTLHATDVENTSSNIFSLDGDITIDKTTGVRNTSITNTSGSIEAFTGDINIYTDALTNNRSSYQYVEAPLRDSNGNFSFSNAMFDLADESTFATDHYYYEKRRWYYNIQGANGAAGQILSGRDINLNAASTYNNAGQIAANRNITITAGSVTNQAYLIQSWEIAEGNYWRGPTYWFNSIDSPGALNIEDPNYVPTTAIITSSITAGNNISGSISNLDNATSGNGSATLAMQSANLSTSILPGAAQVVAVNNTQLEQNQVGVGITGGGIQTGAITTSSQPGSLSSAQTASGTSAAITNNSSPAVLALSLIALPSGNNSLFKTNTVPGANYLIETNVAFIDQTKFLGSDYFLTRIGYTPPSNQKLLGDAFYTTQLVRQQIFEKTAQRYIEHGISTDLGQMQALMDNAVTQKTALNLSVGIELTQTQLASLSSDIIWLVDQAIDGQHALVPVVYLAQATLDGLSGNPANISAGNDLTLTASNNINNSGAITAGRNLSLTAGNDLTNTGGLIKAGNNVTLVATNGDIINQAIKHTAGTSQIHEYIAAQGNITSGANTSLTAANDVDVLASIVTAAGGVDINAGGDVNIASVSTRNRTEYTSKKYTKIDDITTHVSSEITAGTDVNITSGNNTIVQASKLEAGNDVNIEAGGALALLTTSDSEFHQEKKSQKSIMWQSSSDTGSMKSTVSNVEITAGGDVNIHGTNGVAVQYKDIGNLSDSINQLSQAPELAYLKTLQTQAQENPASNIQFQGVQDAYNSWNYKQSGLTPAGAAIIAIAVSVATAGAGSSLGTSVGGFVSGGASTGGYAVAGTVAASATQASFIALSSQAAVTLANNKGDIGKTLKDLASEETVKNMAVAALTAGVTSGLSTEVIGVVKDTGLSGNSLKVTTSASKIGVNAAVGAAAHSAIYGSNIGDGLIDRLKSGVVYAAVDAGAANIGEASHFGEIGTPAQLALHGALGCAAGAALTGNCGAGAAGQVAGEIASELYVKSGGQNIQTALDAGQIGGAVGALAAGGNAEAIYAGSNLGHSAAENNNLLLVAAIIGGLYIAGNGNIVKGTEKLGLVVNQGKEYIYRKTEDGVYALYEMSPAAVNAFGQGLDIPASGLHYIGNAISQGADNLTGEQNTLRNINGAVGSYLNSVGLNKNFLTGLGTLAGGLSLLSSVESNLAVGAVRGGEVGIAGSTISNDLMPIDSDVHYITGVGNNSYLIKEFLENELLSGSSSTPITIGLEDLNKYLSFAKTETGYSSYDFRSQEFLDSLRTSKNSDLINSIVHVNIGRFNPDEEMAVRHLINCVYCTMSVDQTLRTGQAISAMPLLEGMDVILKGDRGLQDSVIENFFGEKFQPLSIKEITRKMLQEGPDATGIVKGKYVSRFYNPQIQQYDYQVGSHVFNVVNQNGVIVYIDGQTGGMAKASIYQESELLLLRPLSDKNSYFTLENLLNKKP